MAPKWDYRLVENTQTADQTATQAAFHQIEVNGGLGWEFDSILDLGEDGPAKLLFRKPSN
jgi:hypothetical protein